MEDTLFAAEDSGSRNFTALLVSLPAAALNATSHLRAPSARDLVYLPLRVALQIDRIVVHTLPRFILRNSGMELWLDSTSRALNVYLNAATEAGAGNIAEAAAQGIQPPTTLQTAMAGWKVFFGEAFQASSVKSYWGMLHYITSRWAFICLTMALILNRVSVYGSSRQRIILTWEKRWALRLIPILLFMSQIYRLLQAIRCQSSPNFDYLRYGETDPTGPLDWSASGGFLYQLTSTILFSSTDQDCCVAVGMGRAEPTRKAQYGSFSLLWPTFLRLSLSHLIDTISCALQQVPVMTEVGMSVFEHSLAFAESETMILHALGLGPFTSNAPSTNRTSTPMSTNATLIPASGTILALSDALTTLGGPHVLDKVNVPIEVLLVALLSCCNALSSNIITALGKQRSLRLLNTGFWGLCFMASFVWGFYTTSSMTRTTEVGELADRRSVSGLLHFPTVAIVGFLPHLVILCGIWVCTLVYMIALMLTAFSLDTNPNIPRPTTVYERFSIAHENLQAAIQVRGINIKWHEDFYTALLRVGFAALTAASEAVFLNEGRSVEMRQFTWLEEDRLDEISAARSKIMHPSDTSTFQIAEECGVPPSSPGGTDRGGNWESGYAKERKLEKEHEADIKDPNGESIVYPVPPSSGVGVLQRSTRFYLLFIFMRGVYFLIAGWVAYGLGVFLDKLGITTRPQWLRKLIGASLKRAAMEKNQMKAKEQKQTLDFWLLKQDGSLDIPKNDDLDIEPEMRRRLMMESPGEGAEEILDERMYGWWKIGGWFGNVDLSGDYQPSPAPGDLDDATSVVSMSTNASTTDGTDDGAWESEPEGQRTPTQERPSRASIHSSRESSAEPFSDTLFDPATLARLLDPPDRAAKEEARLLAAHFTQTARIMTRSQYHRIRENERARVLLAGRHGNSSVPAPRISLYQTPTPPSKRPLTPAEEEEVLESLILSRRHTTHAHPPKRGAAGDVVDESDRNAYSTPACVVCQANPRTIIAWPCRCLCVCEDCRVNLAMNNFGNCVTCRRSVGGFVRLWVP